MYANLCCKDWQSTQYAVRNISRRLRGGQAAMAEVNLVPAKISENM
jgi:hypothetical protein